MQQRSYRRRHIVMIFQLVIAVVCSQYWLYSPNAIVFRRAPTTQRNATQRSSLILVLLAKSWKNSQALSHFLILGTPQEPGNKPSPLREIYCPPPIRLCRLVIRDIARTTVNSTITITVQVSLSLPCVATLYITSSHTHILISIIQPLLYFP